MILNNKVYDALKWIAQYLVPGSAALYFALSDVWGFPYTNEVVGTILAIGTFLGTILGISTLRYRREQAAYGYISSVEKPDVVEESPKRGWFLQGDTYEIIKWVVMIVVPATGTLYFAISTYWGLPYGEQVTGTIAALQTFGGLMLGVSTYNYKRS